MNGQVTPRGRIVLAAGGTGGHVFPAEALAAELSKRGWSLSLITDQRGRAYGGTLGQVETFGVSSAQVLGQSPLARIAALAALLRGTWQARRILRQIRPKAIVGFGGYASVPAIAAGTLLGIPVLIHEQNAVLGRANRLFAKRVQAVATVYDAIRFLPPQVPAIRVGMPVRSGIHNIAGTPYIPPGPDGPVELLVLGGSQGARILTDVVPAALAALPDAIRTRVTVSHQARPEDLERARHDYDRAGIAATVNAFFDDVPERLARAHLLIARAGASTVAEVTVAGRPSVLIPYGAAADDHQTANARAVEAAGGTMVISQDSFTPSTLTHTLVHLLSAPEHLVAMARHAGAWSIPDAAVRLGDAVENLACTPETA
ncbi:undecaprenyldiphospho-muramoylpentapeptide beta-N-acetylglucosaminyltransferase [Haematospirillum jordaniae]|uniref:undecaprenyldiphospho-muramoylpentapeptide beta-N-acetylglucosaminyltransferase n=1 Tax=Haematospirillum jordaniae TaxID=1549855 RepID=UPI001432C150|nr:undecaprenyldiphospho-muramoylpentapeptide beta-N-acetylglucosaminyltransferase [Haematospirillum jordaniae]NKD85229.1 undecaprenyldiphospho-muramoylpentapeptide beta-N-acetylglucosaminyltransferase [Haematospirillum jordaniae]